ncbi:MAG: response regulator transcription factor [Lachnospiraceae bacterium]|nr:response regulator transcription factor [Lachnospiraceae bacterium]
MYKILVADDEPDVLSLLKDYFEINGYEVITAKNGREAVENMKKDPDMVLLDVNMPDGDGLSVCRQVRDYVSCPILFLTARIEDSDKIEGFAAGGDDYIIKPFSIDELGARVAAHIRRDHRGEVHKNVKFFGHLAIDYSAKTVTVDGEEIDFAKKEFQIIELLSLNCGQVFDKERIYEKIWGYDAEGDSTVIAEHVRRIRAKLAVHKEEYHLGTVWGMGYKWIQSDRGIK